MTNDERMALDARDSGTRSGRALAAGFGPTPPAGRGGVGARPRGFRASSEGGRGPNFVTLWIIVSVLWTVATCLRMQRTWGGWPFVLGDPYTWVSLLLPPAVFALLLIGISRIAQRPR
jgi:hypothetical protein